MRGEHEEITVLIVSSFNFVQSIVLYIVSITITQVNCKTAHEHET